MPFANIRISKGSQVLHGWYIHPIPYEMTIKEFFVKLVLTKELSSECSINIAASEVIERVELSETPVSTATQISPECGIIELTSSIGVHIHYQLKNDTRMIPDLSGKPNCKQTLRDDLVNWVYLHNGGWSTQSLADTQGKQFIVSLVETIWYIDMCNHEKLKERSYHIPELFYEFFGRADPESYKQSQKSFDANELNIHCQDLAPYATSSWMLRSNFDWLRDAFDHFIIAISSYVGFLQRQCDITAKNHASENPVRSIDKAVTVKIHKKNIWVAPVDKTKYNHLKNLLIDLPSWKPVNIEEYLPADPGLFHAFSFKIGEYRFNSGNNSFNAISIWKIDKQADEMTTLQENSRIASELQTEASRYHTRAMRINYQRTCDLLLPKVKLSTLRTIYRMLTGNVSAANTTNDAKVDERVKLALELGDPDITIDLHEHRSGRSSKYDTFWKIAAQFLAGKAADVVTAVDERRHDTVVHLATAISVNYLLNQIKRECLPKTPIPSAQWLRLQFWPKNLTRLSSLQFTGLLPLKFMVQTRQLQAFHPDVHYASALFRYEKEFAVKFRKITNLIFLDDKHHCNIGEPEFPVAAVERGKKVMVSKDTTFAVADYDFTKTGIIPSVAMICNIPESINGDFYAGKVHIGLKDPIFQPSSPLRHATELYHLLLDEELVDKLVLCLYTDGGSDYHCTYTCVQLSYICLFIALDLDYFVAIRTPPQHSWKNPVEQIMSILNLGLQSVGLMRTEMNDDSERLISKCGTINEIRKKAEENPTLKVDLNASLQAPINLVRSVFDCQFLKDEPSKHLPQHQRPKWRDSGKRFGLWMTVLPMKTPLLQKFFEHCCTARHYSFTIKKCGEPDCTICHPPRCLPEDFDQLHRLPDPQPGEDMHYKSFEELYGKETTEDHRPSLKNNKTKTKGKMKFIRAKHTMPFCPSAARAKNVGITVNCVECEKPRLLFSAKKLTEKDKTILRRFLDIIFYTCGMSFHNTCDLVMAISPKQHDDTENDDEGDDQEIMDVESKNENERDEPEDLDNEDESGNEKKEPAEEPEKEEDSIREIFSRVFVNDSWSCASQVEKPYYSAGIFPDICFECRSPEVTNVAKGEHPHCSSCGGNTINLSKKRLR
ncbi:uncharacterized protein LOC105326236 [Rhizophagus clarus]|uniref:Uncharacterized protein LOC105326236 n=1 Tax=Rhizophagus clarus TaxID=94130 RepID=A0A8H3MEZ1_9GLOM|nr:uncharacterized protein LOC105326236 [Rhizophagus clarus]